MVDTRRNQENWSRLLLALGAALILLSVRLGITFSLEEPEGSGYDLLLGHGEIWFGILTFVPRGPTLIYWCSLALAGAALTTFAGFFRHSRTLDRLQTVSRFMFLVLSLDYLAFTTGVTAIAVQKALELRPVWLFWGSLLLFLSLLLLLVLRLQIQRRKAFCYAGLAAVNALYIVLTLFEGLTLWGFPALYAGIGLVALGYRQIAEPATTGAVDL